MKKFIFETKDEKDVQSYLDTDPHPCYRLVSVSIYESARYSTWNKTVYAGITWELDERKILKQNTVPK